MALRTGVQMQGTCPVKHGKPRGKATVWVTGMVSTHGLAARVYSVGGSPRRRSSPVHRLELAEERRRLVHLVKLALGGRRGGGPLHGRTCSSGESALQTQQRKGMERGGS